MSETIRMGAYYGIAIHCEFHFPTFESLKKSWKNPLKRFFHRGFGTMLYSCVPGILRIELRRSEYDIYRIFKESTLRDLRSAFHPVCFSPKSRDLLLTRSASQTERHPAFTKERETHTSHPPCLVKKNPSNTTSPLFSKKDIN